LELLLALPLFLREFRFVNDYDFVLLVILSFVRIRLL